MISAPSIYNFSMLNASENLRRGEMTIGPVVARLVKKMTEGVSDGVGINQPAPVEVERCTYEN